MNLEDVLAHQPEAVFHLTVTRDALCLKPSGYKWWKNTAHRRTRTVFTQDEWIDMVASERASLEQLKAEWDRHICTVDVARENGLEPSALIAGALILQEWSWEDSHVYWGEGDRMTHIIAWVKKFYRKRDAA